MLSKPQQEYETIHFSESNRVVETFRSNMLTHELTAGSPSACHTLIKTNGLQMAIIREMETQGRHKGAAVICTASFLSELDIVQSHPVSPSQFKAQPQTTADYIHQSCVKSLLEFVFLKKIHIMLPSN